MWIVGRRIPASLILAWPKSAKAEETGRFARRSWSLRTQIERQIILDNCIKSNFANFSLIGVGARDSGRAGFF
jgi:hypothetical protein